MKFVAVVLFVSGCGQMIPLDSPNDSTTVSPTTSSNASKTSGTVADETAAGSVAITPPSNGTTNPNAGSAAPATMKHQGVWVYDFDTSDAAQISSLETFIATQHLGEVYLSTPPSLLLSPSLPSFIAALHAEGVTVEALIGESSWATPAGQPALLAQIAGIVAFNATQPSQSRYAAVHLDVEPWIGTGDDLSWVTPLTDSYNAAAEALQDSGVSLVADVAGAKVANATLADRQAMLNAVTRLVLMQYEVPLASVVAHTQTFLAGLSSGNGAGTIAAIRAADFGDATIATMAQADTALATTTGYIGWAYFQYADMAP